MASSRFCYGAKIEKVIDGDTIDLSIDLGFNIHHKTRVRLYGVDTPESRTVNKAEKEAGLKAKDFAKEWSEKYPSVIIETVKDKGEKYGRILANVFSDESKQVCLNKELIASGFAKAYFGEKKEAFSG